jgi:hypothetical protein
MTDLRQLAVFLFDAIVNLDPKEYDAIAGTVARFKSDNQAAYSALTHDGYTQRSSARPSGPRPARFRRHPGNRADRGAKTYEHGECWLKDEFGWSVRTADGAMNPTSLPRFYLKCDGPADCLT